MYLLLVSKEGRYMKVKAGFDVRKWAIPLSVEVGGKLEPVTVGFLCFKIEFWTDQDAELMEKLRELGGELHEVEEEEEAAMSIGGDDEDDTFDDEYEDEDREAEQPA